MTYTLRIILSNGEAVTRKGFTSPGKALEYASRFCTDAEINGKVFLDATNMILITKDAS